MLDIATNKRGPQTENAIQGGDWDDLAHDLEICLRLSYRDMWYMAQGYTHWDHGDSCAMEGPDA